MKISTRVRLKLKRFGTNNKVQKIKNPVNIYKCLEIKKKQLIRLKLNFLEILRVWKRNIIRVGNWSKKE